MYKHKYFPSPEALTHFMNAASISQEQIIKIDHNPEARFDFQWTLIYYN